MIFEDEYDDIPTFQEVALDDYKRNLIRTEVCYYLTRLSPAELLIMGEIDR